MIDLETYQPLGDKENTAFFEEYLPKIYERRDAAGLGDIVGEMAAVVIQVEHGDAVNYLAELAVMGPYRLVDSRLTDTHRVFMLVSQPAFPRLIVLEPLTATYEDEITRWNELYPMSRPKRNARYIGEVYRAESVEAVRAALEPQNIRFVYEGDQENGFYCLPHLTFTFLSDFTYNRVGYVDVDLDDDLGAIGLDEKVTLPPADTARIAAAAELQASHGIDGLVLGLDHMATRILAGEREDAILEYLTMVPYYFWGAYNIQEMNSSTNVTRNPKVDDDKKSPARVFTANNTPSFVNSFEGLPMPTEDFVRNFGRRMHHMAYAVTDGHVATEKNVDYVVRELRELGTEFLAHVVGECKDEPNLKQIFSKASRYSLLITEYVERCHGYQGFFTRSNVAALTAAAGEAERYDHGHVFD
jgi:glycosyltransferase involved in cell wall biosynthesis